MFLILFVLYKNLYQHIFIEIMMDDIEIILLPNKIARARSQGRYFYCYSKIGASIHHNNMTRSYFQKYNGDENKSVW